MSMHVFGLSDTVSRSVQYTTQQREKVDSDADATTAYENYINNSL